MSRDVHFGNQRFGVDRIHKRHNNNLRFRRGSKLRGSKRVASGFRAIRKQHHALGVSRWKERQPKLNRFGEIGLIGDRNRRNGSEFFQRGHGTLDERIRAEENDGGFIIRAHRFERLADVGHFAVDGLLRHRVGNIREENNREVISAFDNFQSCHSKDKTENNDGS